MNELEELMENLDLDNYRYFYHVTASSEGSEILEHGLFLEDNNLYSTTIELPEEMITNPVEYCQNENKGRFSRREKMIIIQSEIDDVENLIIDSGNLICRYDQGMKYLIPLSNILCLIDLNDLSVEYNYESAYFERRLK